MALPRGLFIAACCPLALAWSAGPSRSFGRVHSVRPRSLLSLSSAGGADKSGANTAPAANAAPLPPNRAARFGSADPGRPTRVARFIGSLLLLWTWPWILDGARICLTGGTVHATFFAAQLRLVREMSFRLLVASTCGTIMGLERKSADRPAGLRSMTLVSVGSALYTLAVIYGTYSGDPGRAAAQVCTGVGFIGAGVIWKGSSSRAPVRGVTTACAVWVSAALGKGTVRWRHPRRAPRAQLISRRSPPLSPLLARSPRAHRRRRGLGPLPLRAVRVRAERDGPARLSLVQLLHRRQPGGSQAVGAARL